MSTYVIASFLEDDIPTRFSAAAWPVHVTIVRPFVCGESVEEILEELEIIATQHKPIATRGVSKQLFGIASNVPVVELEKTPELEVLHDQIMSFPWIEIVPPLFPDFRPHVSEQVTGKIDVGTEVVLRSISLLQHIGPDREVMGTVQLG